MKRFPILSFILALALLFSAFGPASAAPAPQASAQTIVDIAAGNPNFSTLVTAVKAAGLVDALNAPGPYTVFAPTNEAFARLGQKKINALLADPEALTKVLLYHVVPGKLMSADVISMGQATTLAGFPVGFSMQGGHAWVNRARITAVDIEASNGVIHVINRVIMPPTRDVAQLIAARPNLKVLSGAIKAAGLTETLKGEGPFTVFAPSDDAFAKISPAALKSLVRNKAKLTNVLLYHVFPGSAFLGDALKLSSATMANGQDVTLSNIGGTLRINGNVRVVTYNLIATNGVVHVIDTVLMPPTKTVYDRIAGSSTFDTLQAALDAANLDEALDSPGAFTLFAPTDRAFDKLGSEAINALLADPSALTSVLLYHAVSGKVYAGDVIKLSSATTLNGADVTISVRNGHVFINDSRVIMTNIITTNGVIHVIDTVLLPPAP